VVGLGLFCSKDLQWDDRVEFDDAQADHYGMPAMTIHYTLTDQDHEHLGRARDQVMRWAQSLGEPLGSAPFTLPPGSSLHYQGTTRMGAADDGRSVCGPTSEVWGVPGLFVAGNGVIPTATACNPTLTSVALAVAGARSIAADLT
jgi:choline dehydrogenase-like flavoprotein